MASNKNKNSSEGTIIGTGVKMIGSLKDEGPITVNGEVQGDLHSEQSIYIGENAAVNGPISAKIIIIAGEVEGEVNASESLEITSTGKVNGKIDASVLIVKPGALFIGQCKMSHAEESLESLKPEDEN